ncbi:MAG TPA: GNAT family N-acetyltransferase [Bryobacteraceae bacterium]|nr:GNAT family N-acetyltransferase [Bryobacteraceae bacterium]
MRPGFRSEFSAAFEPLAAQEPHWGTVAILPWDADLFGFVVAEHEPGDFRRIARALPAYREALAGWAQRTKAELIAARVPAAELAGRALLPEAGFRFVDLSLQGELAELSATRLPSAALELRQAQADDLPALEQIALTAFRAGRYHMDPRFPHDLADRRYQHWLRNAFAHSSAAQRVYVTGPPGAPQAFLHLAEQDGVADVRLVAVDRESQGRGVGACLYAAVLEAARASGARQAVTRISASNTPVMNLLAGLGFRFEEPEAIYHWHAPDAPHLVPLGEMF